MKNDRAIMKVKVLKCVPFGTVCICLDVKAACKPAEWLTPEFQSILLRANTSALKCARK